MDIVAFVISTAFGTGQAAMHTALADGRESMALRPDIIGNNYRAQLCVFAPNKSLAGVLDRVLDLISSALQDLTDQLAARAINWPSDVSLVLLTPGADIGFPIENATALAALVESRLRDAGWLSRSSQASLLQGGAGTTAQALATTAALAAAGHPVLLITADSHACRVRMSAMLESNALFSNANPWGFVPGEAACAALILPGGAGIPAVVQVSGFSDTMEPVPERLNQDSTYIGLTEAAIAALEAHARLGLGPACACFHRLEQQPLSRVGVFLHSAAPGRTDPARNG